MEFSHKLDGEYFYEELLLCSMHTKETVDSVKEFKDYSGDAIVASYPKTGTTWTQELVWLLSNDVDLTTAKSTRLSDRAPHIEFYFGPKAPYLRGLDRLTAFPHPRTIKTHLPARFFPTAINDQSCKIVVVIRNPKDTLASLYHFYRGNKGLGCFAGSWDEFFEMFRANHIYFGDFFDWYSSWWQYRDQPNVFFVKYEDMNKDLKKVTKDIAGFLGKSYSNSVLDDLVDHLQFKNMKTNKMTNYEYSKVTDHEISPFMRKGVVGDWKGLFTKEQSDYVDERYKETLEKAGLLLDFE